jgi:O-antigen/teichoic acid export membrane protein
MGGFALIVYLCNTIQFLNYKMDLWFINRYQGDADTGIYALALGLSQLIWVFANAVSAVLLNYYEVGKKEEAVKLALHYGSLSIYFSLAAGIILTAIYYFALPILYGNQFSRVSFLCALLFIGAIPFSLSIIIANLNSGIGFIRINLYGTVFSFLLGLVLDFWLIPVYGVEGAATAKIIVYVSAVLFHIIAGHVLYKLPWAQLFRFPNLRRLTRGDTLSN